MKTLIKNYLRSLQSASKGLEKKSVFINQPWSLIDSDFEIQKLIFKKNNELIMSKDGAVQMGRWEYLSEAKSLLIDRGSDKILFNAGFVNEALMILKRDGLNPDFLILANENILPDLDVYGYLEKLRYEELKIAPVQLTNGKILEVENGKNKDVPIIRAFNNKVSSEAMDVPNGIYITKDEKLTFVIKDSHVADIRYRNRHKTKDGIDLLIEQQLKNSFSKGDKVLIDDYPAPDGKYKLGWGNILKVRDGIISNINIF